MTLPAPSRRLEGVLTWGEIAWLLHRSTLRGAWLITGGNGGIGLGMAEGLAAGASVCIWGTNESKNAAALARLESYGTPVAAMRCDVSDEAAVQRCFAETLERFGRVDGCFANAGVGGRAASFDTMTAEEWRRVLAVNLDGVFYTLRAAARAHESPRRRGGQLRPAYRHRKPRGHLRASPRRALRRHESGLISMAKAFPVEYARYGVTAHTILPGWIETEMTEGAFGNDKFVTAVHKRIPARRWGQQRTSPVSRFTS